MGLFPCFWCEPTPRGLDIADDGMSAFVNVDVLDRDHLRTLAAMPIESFEQR